MPTPVSAAVHQDTSHPSTPPRRRTNRRSTSPGKNSPRTKTSETRERTSSRTRVTRRTNDLPSTSRGNQNQEHDPEDNFDILPGMSEHHVYNRKMTELWDEVSTMRYPAPEEQSQGWTSFKVNCPKHIAKKLHTLALICCFLVNCRTACFWHFKLMQRVSAFVFERKNETLSDEQLLGALEQDLSMINDFHKSVNFFHECLVKTNCDFFLIFWRTLNELTNSGARSADWIVTLSRICYSVLFPVIKGGLRLMP